MSDGETAGVFLASASFTGVTFFPPALTSLFFAFEGFA